ncbi:MAG: aldehyde dehydrogenase family protein [Phycisphaerae bacterium]|nr:aldehyde dehydrogenase family protein [Phycisphaerae bacterium]
MCGMSDILSALGVDRHPRFVPAGTSARDVVMAHNPATTRPLGGASVDTPETLERTLVASVDGFKRWRAVPAPARGQVVRAIAEEFRRLKGPLGELISLEVGKIRSEGLGEVQEVIDIADFSVGLSRQLSGLTLQSERTAHRMFEQWLPLGPVGVITAFNFPCAVWGWNAMLAAVCGDTVVWKPSGFAPLIALASDAIATRVAESMGYPGVFHLIITPLGDESLAEKLVADRRLPLISATGSCRMGRRVGQVVAGRLGRSLLELGGNNAVIVNADADQGLALRAMLFGAVGTAGQRCTTSRRLIIHESIADGFVARLAGAYRQVRLGDPLAEGTLVGPLISSQAVSQFEHAVAEAVRQGGVVVAGGKRADVKGLAGHFVEPTLIRAPASNLLPIAREETFAPILYVFTFKRFEEALEMHNGVDQGLSSAIFTDSLRTADAFLAPDGSGSDCGIANVNIGTSGAEIGGAFGGEKDTGGGRESGSDSWKAYMRRQTCTVNSTGRFELAQGITFQ